MIRNFDIDLIDVEIEILFKMRHFSCVLNSLVSIEIDRSLNGIGILIDLSFPIVGEIALSGILIKIRVTVRVYTAAYLLVLFSKGHRVKS